MFNPMLLWMFSAPAILSGVAASALAFNAASYLEPAKLAPAKEASHG